MATSVSISGVVQLHSPSFSLWQQEFTGSSPKRRRTEEKDEGIGSPDILEEEKLEDLRRELLELRQHLEKERSARAQLEEQVRNTHTYRPDSRNFTHRDS